MADSAPSNTARQDRHHVVRMAEESKSGDTSTPHRKSTDNTTVFQLMPPWAEPATASTVPR